MPSKSEAQHRLMLAAAHNADFAKRSGVSQEVAKEFVEADKRKGKFQGKRKSKKRASLKRKHAS